MHIGIISYDFDPPIGGLGIVARKTRETLSKLYPNDTYTVLSPSPCADEHVSRVAVSRWGKRGGCPLFSLMLHFRLPALIRKLHFDCIHVHAGSGGVFILKRPSCPMVVTSHHTYLQEAEIVFARFPVKRLLKKAMAVLEKRTYDIADRVVCVSKDTAEAVIRQYRIPREKVCVIENTVETKGDCSDCKKDPATILYIGRLEERKGIWTLLKAAELLRLSHPTARFRFIGRNMIGNRLFKYLEEKNLNETVTVLGHVHEPFMIRELEAATLLVVPSLLEGFGLVAADALVSGTCVVASDAPGLRSIIRDHDTGLLFKAGDPVDCARAISEALDHPALRVQLAEKGRADGIKRFSHEERARDLHEKFERLP